LIYLFIYWVWQPEDGLQRIRTYRHTYSKKLGLYIEYIHAIKSASGAGSSKVSTVWKNSFIGLYERELLDIST